MRHRPALQGLLWVSPWIIGFLLFMAAPVWLSLRYSFTDYSLLEPAIPVGLGNYEELLRDPMFWITIRNTAIYAFFAIVIGTVVSIGVALLLNVKAPGRDLARAAVFLPTLVPVVAAALAWMWMFNGEYGLLNVLLRQIGIAGPSWLGDRTWAMAALLLIGLWQVGAQVVIYVAALQDVPRTLYEAAAIDGVRPLARLRRITLPMISPAILFNVIMGVIWSIQIFAVPHIMTRGGPENATYFYSMYVYANAFVYGRMGYASALAWIQLVVILLLTVTTLIASRRFVYYRAA